MEPGVAVKAFIVDGEGKLLIVKRADDDIHMPNVWEIPGGRLDNGEDPFEGLKRETKEEVGLDIEIIMPINVHYFTREDSQVITLITFWCKPISKEVKLSYEHTEYEWAALEDAYKKMNTELKSDISIFRNYLT